MSHEKSPINHRKPARKSSAARRRALARRRKKERQRRILLLMAAVLCLLLLTVFGISSCAAKKRQLEREQQYLQELAQKEQAAREAKAQQAEARAMQEKEEAEAAAAQPISLTISVVGDCTLGTDVSFDYSTSLNAYYEMYGSSYFMENVRPIFAADDLTIANFEGTLTESDNRQDKLFAFKATADYASILTQGSIEAVNTANNHSHDYGEESFSDTMDALDAEGIVHFGYDETAVTEVKGVSVGLVGIYELNDHLGRVEQLKEKIAEVKDAGAQLVIVIFHWGNEKEELPDEYQTTLGRMAIDEGADLVCGHHPHVLQGIETYKGKNIVYSLGNFCFGGNSYPSDMDTMIYQQTFTIQNGEVADDMEVNLIPCSISSEAYVNNYQPTPAEGAEAERILEKIRQRSGYITLAATDSRNYFGKR